MHIYARGVGEDETLPAIMFLMFLDLCMFLMFSGLFLIYIYIYTRAGGRWGGGKVGRWEGGDEDLQRSSKAPKIKVLHRKRTPFKYFVSS